MKLHGRVRRGRGVSHFVRQLAERTHARSAESHVSFTPQLRSGLSVAFRIHPVRNSVSNGVHPRANAPESEFQTKDQLFGGTRFARPTFWVLLYLFLQNWSRCPGLNRRPRYYQYRALPTELHRRIDFLTTYQNNYIGTTSID